MPPRSVKMKRRILGFQRRVWWPKWTPASRSSRIETTGTDRPLSVGLDCYRRGRVEPALLARRHRHRADPPGRVREPRHGSRRRRADSFAAGYTADGLQQEGSENPAT